MIFEEILHASHNCVVRGAQDYVIAGAAIVLTGNGALQKLDFVFGNKVGKAGWKFTAAGNDKLQMAGLTGFSVDDDMVHADLQHCHNDCGENTHNKHTGADG